MSKGTFAWVVVCFYLKRPRQEKEPVLVHRRTQREKNHCFQLSVPSEICCEISKCGAAGGGEAALSQGKVKENHSRSKNQEGTRRGHWSCGKPRGVWPDGEAHVVKVRESERRGLEVKSSHMPLASFQRLFSPPLSTRPAYAQSSCLNLRVNIYLISE